MKKSILVVTLLMVVCVSSFAGISSDSGYTLLFPAHPVGLNLDEDIAPMPRQCVGAMQELLFLPRWIIMGGYRMGDPIDTLYAGLCFAVTSRLVLFGQIGNWEPEAGEGDTTVQSGFQFKLGRYYDWDLSTSGAYGTTSSGSVDFSGLSGELNGIRPLDAVPGLNMTAGLNMTRWAWDGFGMDDSGIEFNFFGGLRYDTPVPGLTAGGTAGIIGEEPAITLDGTWKINF